MVRSHPGLCVLAVVATGSDLLKEAAIHQPDIILADIALPGLEDRGVLLSLGGSKQAKLIFSWDYHEEPLVRNFAI